MSKFRFLILFSNIIFFNGCKNNNNEDQINGQQNSEASVSDSVEAAITSLVDSPDEQSDQDLAFYNKSKTNTIFELLNPIPNAYAATCSGRAVTQPCVSGIKIKNYTNCSIGVSDHQLNGSVSLTYSDTTNCNIDSNGEFVTRTYDVTRTTPWGAKIRTFSTSKTDYEGDTYGGGTRLEQTGSGYELTILGKHKTRTSSNGRSRLDLSINTETPISFNQLTRSGRIVDGGSLIIAHNLAKYKMTLQPNNLGYSANCCYPTSGSIDISYSGSVNGSGLVSFSSCGKATVTKDSKSYDIEFYSCE